MSFILGARWPTLPIPFNPTMAMIIATKANAAQPPTNKYQPHIDRELGLILTESSSQSRQSRFQRDIRLSPTHQYPTPSPDDLELTELGSYTPPPFSTSL
jgi:hypothetical protein